MRASTWWSHRPRIDFALRAYDAGPAQIGSEPTPTQYLEALWAATAEMIRVLKPSGSIFVDLGDKYSGNETGGRYDPSGTTLESTANVWKQQQRRTPYQSGLRPKSLMLLPERYRVGCVDRLGLIARAVIVWGKPNGLPESVTDRVRRSHEDFVHLVKQPRYYSAIDEVRESSQQRNGAMSWDARLGRGDPTRQGEQRGTFGHAGMAFNPLGKLPGSVWTIPSEPLNLPGYFVAQDGQLLDFLAPTRGGRRSPRPNGHHPGLFDSDAYAELIVGEDANAWRWMRATGVTSSPWPKVDTGLQLHTGADHYAAFASRWPEQLIKGWSPPGICLDCGQGRVPVVDMRREPTARQGQVAPGWRGPMIPGREDRTNASQLGTAPSATILGYACACTPFTDHPGSGDIGHRDLMAAYGDARKLSEQPRSGAWREYHLDRWTPPPTRPAVVLDPFGGVGTTSMVARALGRIGLSFDLSHAYSRAARWRIWSDNAAKAISRTNLERQGSLL